MTQREEILRYAKDFFGTDPDYPWDGEPEYAVLRHSKNKKWYGLIMRIPRRKLIDGAEGDTDVLNIKCEPTVIGSMILRDGCFPAYHMSKEHWLTVLLDGTVPLDEITALLSMSYDLTDVRVKK